MKRSRKPVTGKKKSDEEQEDESYSEEANVDSESKDPAPNLTPLSALDAPASVSQQMRLLAQLGVFTTGFQPLGASITPAAGFGLHSSVSLRGQDSVLWGNQRHQNLEQQRHHLLTAQILLQKQQQEQAFLAAIASAGATTLPNFFPSTDAQHLATLGSRLAAREQLEMAHAQLRSPAMLSHGPFSATEQHAALTSLVRPEDLSPRSKQDEKLPYYYDATKGPDPSSVAEDDDEENQGSTSEHAGDASAAALEKFPLKLYRMLDDAETNGDDSIVSFFPHGRAFAIHKPREFVSELMPKYFSTTRMSSFQRQLNLYGFRRITDGQDKGGYFHEHFLRGRKKLCKKIHRKKTMLRSPPETSEREASEEILDSPLAAASTSGLNPAFLAELSQQNLLQQQQQFLASMQRFPQGAANMTLPTSNNALLGVGNAFGNFLFPGLGASTQTGPLTETGRIASEMASIERHRSDLLRQLHLVQQQQHQYDSKPAAANKKGDQSDSSE
jgi:hypothetical protein